MVSTALRWFETHFASVSLAGSLEGSYCTTSGKTTCGPKPGASIANSSRRGHADAMTRRDTSAAQFGIPHLQQEQSIEYPCDSISDTPEAVILKENGNVCRSGRSLPCGAQRANRRDCFEAGANGCPSITTRCTRVMMCIIPTTFCLAASITSYAITTQLAKFVTRMNCPRNHGIGS